MRLYEFTDPRQYLLPETDAADLVKQGENIRTVDTTDTAERRQTKKLGIRKPTDTL